MAAGDTKGTYEAEESQPTLVYPLAYITSPLLEEKA